MKAARWKTKNRGKLISCCRCQFCCQTFKDTTESTRQPNSICAKKNRWGDLTEASTSQLRKVFSRLLNIVVALDTKSTRRDNQLNHLCNLLLVKLESDKLAKLSHEESVGFQVWDSELEIAKCIQKLFSSM